MFSIISKQCTVFKQQLTDISKVLKSTGEPTKFLTSFYGLNEAQQKVLLSSSLLSTVQKEQCAAMMALSSANTRYTAAQLTAITGISAETLANWGLLTSTDALTISELAEKAASDAQAKTALDKILTQNAQIAVNSAVTATNTNLAASEGNAALATGIFTSAIKANISSMIKWMTTTPLGWLTMLAGGVFLAVKSYDALTISVEEQQEKMEASVSAYEDTKNELSNITSELETQEQKLTELSAKSNLTYAEQGQLDKLQKITKELRIQKDLTEKKEKRERKEAAKDASDLFQKKFGKYEISEDKISEYQNDTDINNALSLSAFKNNISAMIASYEEYKNLIKDDSKGSEEIELLEKDLERVESDILSYAQELQDQKENISDYYDIIKDTPTDKLSSEDQKIIDDYTSIESAIKLIYSHLDPNTWNTIEIDSILSAEDIEKTEGELLKMIKSGELTSESIVDFSNLSKAIENSDLLTKDGQEKTEAFYNEMLGRAETMEELNDNIEIKPLTFTDTASQIQSLSSNLDMLNQIYADVADQGLFDWASILNNEGFKEIFSGFTEEYDNFIKTISNAPNDVEACQSAFDSLASAYINGCGIMDHLTDETKDMTATMLEQMGVSNAQEMVTARLAADEAFLAEKKRNTAIASSSLASATWQEIYAILSEGNASRVAESYLAQLALSKLNISEYPIDSRADIDSIIAIANAAGVSKEYINALQTALETLQNKQELTKEAENSSLTAGVTKANYIALSEAEEKLAAEEVNSILNKISEYTLDPSSFYANFGDNTSSSKAASDSSGGSPTDSSLSEIQESVEEAFEETFNWLEHRIKNLQRLFDKWLKQAENALTGRFINKYYKKAEKSLKKELNTYDKSYGLYMNKAKETGLDESYAKKVRNGTLDIETVTDQKLAEQIKDYQEWYDKATEAAGSFLETAEKLYNLPLEKAAAKIELFKDAITLLDKKLSNAIGSASKNNLLSQKDKEEEKTLKAQQKALTESKKNLKKSAKTLKQSNTLANSGLTKKQKAKIEKDIKNRQEIDISQFKEGSKAYKAAVKYNEALKAKQDAKYQRDLAKEDLSAWKVESAKLKFDNISNDYERKIQLIDHNILNIDSQISLLTSAGKKVDRSLYESQKSYQMQTLAQYQAQQKALSESLKEIRHGTDEWYDANDKINQLNDSIAGCQKQIYEMNNALSQIRFDQFKELAESLERIITEQDFLQNLFSHEKTIDNETAQFTEAGLAKLGSLSTSYHAAKEKADNDKVLLNELLQVKEFGKQTDDSYKLGDWEFNSLEDLEAKIKETYTTWQGDIKETYSLESSLADMRADQYKAELDIVKDLIDAKKKALSSEKELHDYQNSIQEKTNDIVTLQKQITAYSGDSSQEGLAKLQKLQKELADRQEDLAETEYDRYISDQQDMLDKLYEEYEETITKKIEDFDENVQAALKLANDNISLIADYLSQTAEKKDYIIENTDLFAGQADKLPNLANDSVSNTEQSSALQSQTPPLNLSWAESHPRMVRIDNHASSKETILQTKNKNSSVKTVKNISELTQSSFLQEISNKVPETISSFMNKDRMLLIPNSMSHLDTTSSRTESNNVVNISTLTLPNVTNYEEFKDKMFRDMQSSRKYENMLNGITVNRLSGSGRLDKYKYKP